MGRVKLSAANRQTTNVVVLHLDRAIAHDLLLALVQALEPHPANTGKFKKNLQKGRSLKGVRLKAKGVKGQSVKGKSLKKKSAKGKDVNERAQKPRAQKGRAQKKSR